MNAISSNKTQIKSGQRPDKKAGRVYGVNAGLAFAMCEALQKRKNRQGGLKLFFVLIFGYFVSRQSNSPAAIERNDYLISHKIFPTH